MSDAHPNRTRLFLGVAALLGLLTLGSFGVANSAIMENPMVGWSLMMGISVAKAMLVILFFMHLRWETNWKYVLTIPAGIMSFVLVFMLVPDIALRAEKYSRSRLQNAPQRTSQRVSPLVHVEPSPSSTSSNMEEESDER